MPGRRYSNNQIDVLFKRILTTEPLYKSPYSLTTEQMYYQAVPQNQSMAEGYCLLDNWIYLRTELDAKANQDANCVFFH